MIGRALEKGIWKLDVRDLRSYGHGKHLVVDDTPFGGGAGMVIRPDVVDAALQDIHNSIPQPGEIVYLSPRGHQFTQNMAHEFSQMEGITLLCGRYEGIDERVLAKRGVREVRVGDAVLCGGEVAAALLLEATVRLLPGVIKADSLRHETFSEPGLAEHPQYAGLREWEGREVPPVLYSGNHAEIEKWKRENSRRVPE